MDFGRSGNEFWHTWWPRGPEELNSPAFKLELQEVVDTLRESVLKNRFAMERFCYEHGGKISGGWTQNYGYIVETERYRYCLRCNPSPGDYNCYCTAYDLDVQRQNMARDKPLVGRVTYANGDAQEFTDAEAFLKCVREELAVSPHHRLPLRGADRRSQPSASRWTISSSTFMARRIPANWRNIKKRPNRA